MGSCIRSGGHVVHLPTPCRTRVATDVSCPQFAVLGAGEILATIQTAVTKISYRIDANIVGDLLGGHSAPFLVMQIPWIRGYRSDLLFGPSVVVFFISQMQRAGGIYRNRLQVLRTHHGTRATT